MTQSGQQNETKWFHICDIISAYTETGLGLLELPVAPDNSISAPRTDYSEGMLEVMRFICNKQDLEHLDRCMIHHALLEQVITLDKIHLPALDDNGCNDKNALKRLAEWQEDVAKQYQPWHKLHALDKSEISRKLLEEKIIESDDIVNRSSIYRTANHGNIRVIPN